MSVLLYEIKLIIVKFHESIQRLKCYVPSVYSKISCYVPAEHVLHEENPWWCGSCKYTSGRTGLSQVPGE